MGPRTQQGLVGSATTSNNTNHATGAATDNLLRARGQLDTRLSLIGVVTNNSDIVTGSAAQSTTVADLLLDVGDDGTLRHGAERKDVADRQSSVLASIDKLAGVHALISNEGLGLLLELVWTVEHHTGEGSTTAGVVDDLSDDATDVSVALRIIERAELRRSLAEAGVGREDGPAALALVADLGETS